MNLPINLKILLTGLLKPVNYGKKSVVDNIGPCLYPHDEAVGPQKNGTLMFDNCCEAPACKWTLTCCFFIKDSAQS
jgi:hypothetical protein